MTTPTTMESIKGEGTQLVERLKQIIHEGNIRRVVIKQGETIVAEFPLTFGVIGTVIAPVLAAIGALAALLTDCSIEVERLEAEPKREAVVTNGKASEDETTLI